MAKDRKYGKTEDMLSFVNYGMSFIAEKKHENGEDSESHSFNTQAAYFGVFDGCGGAGAQSCPKYHGKTEAYIASRTVSEVFQRWFDSSDVRRGWDPDVLKNQILSALTEDNELVGEKSLLMGGIKKKFPTTAAAAVCCRNALTAEADIYWAGDSRVYLLTPDGLAQLTEDDLGGIDAMENLSEDGTLQNVISLSKDFVIHCAHISIPIEKPGILFAATDGCFGYLSTPMEFEYLLLDSLEGAECVSSDSVSVEKSPYLKKPIGWMETLEDRIGKVSGDDYTLSGFSFGFESFESTKKAFFSRYCKMYDEYIAGMNEKNYDEQFKLWRKYKVNYERLLRRAY